MSFKVREHIVPAQHIRELPDALAIDDTTTDATLYLHVKQYIPCNNPEPQPGDLTIIAFSANGFCKETYEPVWDHLLAALPSNKRIRSIWSADYAQQGSSYILNESKLGSGVAWEDHVRDTLVMVNHFKAEMQQPILGIGHSLGGHVLLKITNVHARLFHSICLLDTTLWTSNNTPAVPIQVTLHSAVRRKDSFTCVTAAREALEKSIIFKSWHPRSLDLYFANLFRPMPTVLFPDIPSPSTPHIPKYTLRTPKQMEAYSLYRPNIHSRNTSLESSTRLDRLLMPYMHYDSSVRAPVANPNPLNAVLLYLPTLRPRCLFLYGATSPLGAGRQAMIDRKRNLEITGVQGGGSGGVALGCVAEDTINGGHLFPFEHPVELGERLARWVGEEQDVWREERKMVEEALWRGRTTVKERQDFEPGYVDVIRKWNGIGWEEVAKVAAEVEDVPVAVLDVVKKVITTDEVMIEAKSKEKNLKAML